jgi:hypothetical protein
MPIIERRTPTEKEADALSIRNRMLQHFHHHPDDRMVVWFKLWKAANPNATNTMITWLRAHTLRDTKFLMRREGCFIWFTMRPPWPEEDWTYEQRQAWDEYNTKRSTGRPPKPGTDELSLRRRARMGGPTPMAERLSALRARQAMSGEGPGGTGATGGAERGEQTGEA